MESDVEQKKEIPAKKVTEYVYQCKHCMTVYDEKAGEPLNGINPGVAFENLPQTYCCPLCESPGEDFIKTRTEKLGWQPV